METGDEKSAEVMFTILRRSRTSRENIRPFFTTVEVQCVTDIKIFFGLFSLSTLVARVHREQRRTLRTATNNVPPVDRAGELAVRLLPYRTLRRECTR